MKTDELKDQLRELPGQILRVKKILFLALVVIVYVFVVWRFTVLRAAEPTEKAVASHQATQKLPTIDPATVKKIQQLQNNSVSVQALFNQARQDPFNE